MGMISTILIAGFIFASAGLIIYKKIMGIKAGGCSGCSNVSCTSFKSLESMNDLNLLNKK